MVPFKVLEVQERMDGSVFVEYETVADDGDRLVEGDVFTPNPESDLEEAIVEWLNEKKRHRAEINDRPRRSTPKPRVKRSTAVLNDQAVNRVRSRVEE